MKKIMLLFSLGILVCSCSTSDTGNSSDFFNLSNDNLWVYKRYNSNDNVNYTFSNRIDSVRVTGDTLIAGITFTKLQHKIYNSGVFSEKIMETLRVDSNGHLVNQNNVVYHPGTDSQFQNVKPIYIAPNSTESIGSLTEQLQNPFSTNVEGVNYFVYPYYGDFVSMDPAIPNNYIFYQYKEGMGLVCQHCAGVSGTFFYEDRLVYAELN